MTASPGGIHAIVLAAPWQNRLPGTNEERWLLCWLAAKGGRIELAL